MFDSRKVSSHVTLNMSLAKPGTGAKFHHVCNPPLGQRRSPSTSPYWGWNLHWISGDVKQNPIKISEIWRCVFHITFTNLWTMAVSEVIGNMLGNNYWLGTSFVILCNQQREMDLSEQWKDYPKNIPYLSQGKFPDKAMFVVSGQGWHLLNH
jgi:hypothetical protein